MSDHNVIARVGDRLARVFERTAPDPLVIAVLLTALAAALAIAFGTTGQGPVDRISIVFDAWRADSGLWRFLAFGMQMCLILVTGYALAQSVPARAAIRTLAAAAGTQRRGVVIVAVAAMACGLINWGLGLIVGALLARAVVDALRAHGAHVHAPIMAAAGYSGMLVWHGGLSGSAPLTMTTRENAARVMEPTTLERLAPDGVPLTDTIGSVLNLVGTGGLLLIVPVVLAMLVPTKTSGLSTRDVIEAADTRDEHPRDRGAAQALPDRLEASRTLAWGLGLALLAGVVAFAMRDGALRFGLNEMNAAMLGLGLCAHGSLRRYAGVVEDGARGCAGIIVQFPLYAGILAMLLSSGLATRVAGSLASMTGERTLPLVTFASAGLLNLFVPSGGGQWGIQGPVALEAGAAAGVAPGTMIMAVAFGDQLTNMLQPFWALPLLAITGVRAREIVGYTCVVMVAAGAWLAVALLVLG